MILAGLQEDWSSCTFFRALAFTPKYEQAMEVVEEATKSVHELQKMVSSCHVVSCLVESGNSCCARLVAGAGQCRGFAAASAPPAAVPGRPPLPVRHRQSQLLTLTQ